MIIYYDDLDYEYDVSDKQIAEAVADAFRRRRDVAGLKTSREDNSLEKFIELEYGFIPEEHIKDEWLEDIKDYWYKDAEYERGDCTMSEEHEDWNLVYKRDRV